MLSVGCEYKGLISAVSWQWKDHRACTICAYSEHIIMRYGTSWAACIHYSRRWKLSQQIGHHTQTCPSNTWLPWKQPSSSLAQGGCSNIMENQTEPCQPGDVTFKATISSLSLSVSGYSPVKYTKQGNKQISMQLQAAPSWVTIFLLKWMQTPWHVQKQ